MLTFSMKDTNRIPSPKRYTYDVSLIFLSLFQASLCQLSLGHTNNYKLDDLLPYGENHIEFSNNKVADKLTFISGLASELYNSITFTLSFSGYKNTTRSTSMSTESDNVPTVDYDNWFNQDCGQSAKFLSKEFIHVIFNEFFW